MNSHIASSQIVKESLRPANGFSFNVWMFVFAIVLIVTSVVTAVVTTINSKYENVEAPSPSGRMVEGVVTHAPDANPQKKAVPKHGKYTVIETNVATTVSDTELKCLYKNAFYEAGVEGVIGSLAVSQIVMKRLERRAWGNNVCSVVYARSQFSWTALPTLEKPSGALWQSAKEGVDAYLRGARIKELENAMHYHASWMDVYPKWSKAMTQVAAIGNHIFYAH